MSDLALFLYVVALITVSYSLSSWVVAGIPAAMGMLGVLLLSHAADVGRALRLSRALRVLCVLWVLWITVTTVRLIVDYPVYGTLALRDATTAAGFGGVLLGAAAFVRWGKRSLLAASRTMSWILCAYTAVTLVREVLPAPLSEVFSTQNAGVAGVALVASALWSRGIGHRLVCLAAGSVSVLQAQSRMLTLMVVLLPIVYLALPQRSGDKSPTTRLLALGLMIGGVLGLAAVMPLVPFVGGRLGPISVQMMGDLVASVFDDDSALAGTRHARESWWAAIAASMNAEPHTYLTGLGLGADLTGGFRSTAGELVRKPHNDYYEALARVGIVGVVALAGIIVTGIVRCAQLLTREPNAGLVFGWLVAASAMAFSQPYFSYAHGAVPAALIVGIVTMAVSSDRPETWSASTTPLPSGSDR